MNDYRTRYDRGCYKCRNNYCPGNCEGKVTKIMNERIKELLTPKLKEWAGDSDDNFSEELEKFAELIVRECMKICQNHPSIIFKNEWDADVVATDIVSRLESHFGVTE